MKQIKPVEEMGWEKELTSIIENAFTLRGFIITHWEGGPELEEVTIIKDFIRETISTAVKEERKRIAEGVKGTNPKMPDEVLDLFLDEYDDYCTGYLEAKLDALEVIQPK